MTQFHLFQYSFGVKTSVGSRRIFSVAPTLLISLSLCLLLAACDGGPEADRQATVAALGEAVVQTATASADDEVSPQELLATAEAAATEAVSTISAFSTQAAEAVLTTAAITAAAPTREPVVAPPPPNSAALSPEALAAELVLYGVDPAAGALTWFEPVVVLVGEELLMGEGLLVGEGLQQFQPDTPSAAVPVQDFVLAADITLGSPVAGDGCGFTLRADGLEQLSSQYLLQIGLTEPGPILFQTWVNGALSPDEAQGVAFADPAQTDPLFSLEAGAVNRLTVIANGERFIVYTNGTYLAEFAPLTPLEAGLVALAGVSEGNTAVCQFENVWLWTFN